VRTCRDDPKGKGSQGVNADGALFFAALDRPRLLYGL
jgi:hypothetical protein